MDEQPKVDFMQELYKIALNWLAKQAASVMLLSIAVVFLYQNGQSEVAKLEHVISRQDAKIESQGEEIRKCDMERAALQVEVNSLRQRIELLVPQLKRLR